MYPAQGLADAIYTADDLPDDVTVDGASFSRSGTTYGNTTNGVIFEEDVWAKYRNGARSTRPCLIQGGVVDQFADTYTVTIIWSTDVGNITELVQISRESLCRWTGFDSLGTLTILEYNPVVTGIPENLDLKWILTWCGSINTDENFCQDYIAGPKELQNSPTGTYQEAISLATATVS